MVQQRSASRHMQRRPQASHLASRRRQIVRRQKRNRRRNENGRRRRISFAARLHVDTSYQSFDGRRRHRQEVDVRQTPDLRDGREQPERRKPAGLN